MVLELVTFIYDATRQPPNNVADMLMRTTCMRQKVKCPHHSAVEQSMNTFIWNTDYSVQLTQDAIYFLTMVNINIDNPLNLPVMTLFDASLLHKVMGCQAKIDRRKIRLLSAHVEIQLKIKLYQVVSICDNLK